MQYEVYNKYTGDSEFVGTAEECEEFLANYGGGWAALSTPVPYYGE